LLRHNASAKIISTGERFVEIRLEAPRHCGATTDDLKMLVEKCLLDAAPDAQISVTASQPRADFVALDTLRAVATER
jgi:hypothetical protein